MPEPFKNLFNLDGIATLGQHLSRVSPAFDARRFVAFASDGLEALELKARASHITDALEQFLPADFEEAVALLVASLDPVVDLPLGEEDNGDARQGVRGWMVMPMADYVARHGQDALDLSLDALQQMTMRFSAEFAIRPFIDNHPSKVLPVLADWTLHENVHVRRLVSEGTRPRLPWAMQLPNFIADPSPILPLLEQLKDDDEEYVRRSVANNLNDITKDHPDLVADLAGQWMQGADKNRARLVRHALRSLIKAGHPGALKALGYGPPQLTLDQFNILTPLVALGEALEFEICLTSTTAVDQPLIIDYVVRHMRANGRTSPKVFKWKTVTLNGKASLKGTRQHRIKPITTRRYYAGTHRVELLVNGVTMGGSAFELAIDQ